MCGTTTSTTTSFSSFFYIGAYNLYGLAFYQIQIRSLFVILYHLFSFTRAIYLLSFKHFQFQLSNLFVILYYFLVLLLHFALLVKQIIVITWAE
jgi:hypothetical protein